jgi:hypothetical protein
VTENDDFLPQAERVAKDYRTQFRNILKANTAIYADHEWDEVSLWLLRSSGAFKLNSVSAPFRLQRGIRMLPTSPMTVTPQRNGPER